MRFLSILEKKRDNLSLSTQEINAFIHGVVDATIAVEQIAALLMAIRIHGMNPQETADLALAMANSGQIADLSSIEGVKVDKHSTGGVGDTTTLIAIPLAAACGVKVAKMSGRSLGHTGGTLDKLWSIPGMRTDLSMDELTAQVSSIGCAVIGQTQELAPADRLLYALRDITATVDSLPLIASSILSKKIAAGCDAIVLDCKCGSGAFMQSKDDAVDLAHAMVDIGEHAGKKTIAIVSDMNQPLGKYIGNALEVREAIEVLRGNMPGALMDLSCLLASYMVRVAGLAGDQETAFRLVKTALASGSGLAKLRALIMAQGGEGEVIDNVDLLPSAKLILPVLAPKDGYISSMQCDTMGLAAQALGASRIRKEDVIDPSVGLVLTHRIGEKVTRGQPIAYLHAQDHDHAKDAQDMLLSAIRLSDLPVDPPNLVLEIIQAKHN